jgi:hypothetical protein
MVKISIVMAMCVLSLAGTSFRPTPLGEEPNPPTWPDSVKIIDPADPGDGQAAINSVYAQNGGHSPDDNGQFVDTRYALFFKPGNHAVDVNVGYYTSVYGLGKTP